MNSRIFRAAIQRHGCANAHHAHKVNKKALLQAVVVSASLSFVAGCTLDQNSAQFSTTETLSQKTVARDIEAPEVFQMTGAAVWDGRPSLGGVWVAHSSARAAEKVIIRNGQNGKFVIGALFRRAPVKVGPRIQMSADAAQALGVSAGQPVNLDITALRPHKISQSVEKSALPMQTATGKSSTKGVDNASINAKANLQKPFLQLGIFNVQKNAENAAISMRQLGIIPLVKQQAKDGKPFWRVLVGPANSSLERATLLKKVRSVGFEDAYAVTH